MTAPMRTTVVTLVASMMGPAMRLPRGTVPPKHMIHSAITRPRLRSSRRCCSTVDSDVITAK